MALVVNEEKEWVWVGGEWVGGEWMVSLRFGGFGGKWESGEWNFG